jgi:hypothetical protein
VTTVLSGIAFYALMQKTVDHVKERLVQYMTNRQIRKWQRELEKTKPEEKKIVARARAWKRLDEDNGWN